MIWADLLHLSVNQWGHDTWYPEDARGWKASFKDRTPCDDGVWRRITDRLAQVGANMVVIDVGDAVKCPSHPELAVSNAWSAEKMSAEVARLKSIGLEAVPKLNFATTHDHWLHEYGRMVGTPQYYDVCRDMIRDVCDIFAHPRLFHIGMDEELMDQIRVFKGIGTFRRGRAYWHDVKFYATCCEKAGARPWMFSDYVMDYEKEFLANCPKSIVQSVWYYWDKFENEPKDKWFRRTHWESFARIERGGFDQIPCGSSWTAKGEKEIDNQIGQLVEHVGKVVSKERILGYLQTSWEYPVPGVNEEKNMRAIEHIEATIRKHGK